MLHFYNWRVKRSGACLRIIGDFKLIDGPISHGKISNVGAIELDDNRVIWAHDREGKIIARLHTRDLVDRSAVTKA